MKGLFLLVIDSLLSHPHLFLQSPPSLPESIAEWWVALLADCSTQCSRNEFLPPVPDSATLCAGTGKGKECRLHCVSSLVYRFRYLWYKWCSSREKYMFISCFLLLFCRKYNHSVALFFFFFCQKYLALVLTGLKARTNELTVKNNHFARIPAMNFTFWYAFEFCWLGKGPNDVCWNL